MVGLFEHKSIEGFFAPKILICLQWSYQQNVPCAKLCIHAVMLISFYMSCRYFEQIDLADQPEWIELYSNDWYHRGIEEEYAVIPFTDAAFRQKALQLSNEKLADKWRWRLFASLRAHVARKAEERTQETGS